MEFKAGLQGKRGAGGGCSKQRRVKVSASRKGFSLGRTQLSGWDH